MSQDKGISPNTGEDSQLGSVRRSFLTTIVSLLVGAVPATIALVAFFSPLRRKQSAAGEFVRIASLDVVPDDGLPHRFEVIHSRTDAWNRYPAEPVGAVYLVRAPGGRVPLALTATCPHAGCFVDYRPGQPRFQCPCHTSAFDFQGHRLDGDKSVSPRDMDSLDVELRPAAVDAATSPPDVWVRFQRFEAGRHDKIAQA